MIRPAILSRLRGVQRSGTGWVAYCPAHTDREKRSLSVSLGENERTLLHCFVGCAIERICSSLSMSLADLAAPSTNGHRSPSHREIAHYDYRNERGTLLYQVVRFEPKDFRPRRPDGGGGWIWSLENVRRVIYRLDALAEQRRVFLVEGEKDADRLWSLDIPAATTPSGADAWRDDYAQQIRDAGVEEIIGCADNDRPGRSYITRAAAALTALGVTVRVLQLPGLVPKGDVSDWLEAGHGKVELLALAEAAPLFTGETRDAEPSDVAEPQLLREGRTLPWSGPTGCGSL